MEALIAVLAALTGLVGGFVAADWRQRLKLEARLLAAEGDWRETLGKIQAVHNQQVQETQGFTDRLGSLEMQLVGMKR